MIPVYIGFDPIEEWAFWVCAASILRHSTQPVQIIPLWRKQLPLTRPRDAKQSNEFSFTRFLVPSLQEYKGFAIYIDCDFLFFGDISELWFLRDTSKAVQVCKHPSDVFEEGTKYLGNTQTLYPKKCWSSLMLFNCEHLSTGNLTQEYVDTAHGLDLHQFRWCQEEEIGSLPLEWNWLVGYYPYVHPVKAVHYTQGGPYFHQYEGCDYAIDWNQEAKRTRHIQQSPHLH